MNILKFKFLPTLFVGLLALIVLTSCTKDEMSPLNETLNVTVVDETTPDNSYGSVKSVHRMTLNPKTVIDLEDTHFRPND